MIDIVTDPFPGDEAMRALWFSAWGDKGPDSFQPILSRSLGHVGAFDGEALVGFVNIAWDGGVHAFILDTCVDTAHQRQGIALKLCRVRPSWPRRGARIGCMWISSRIWRRSIANADLGRRVQG